MESTFDRSRRSSSNCFRMEGVMRERTISDRFSRVMTITRECQRKPPRPEEASRGVKRQRDTRGGGTKRAGRGKSCRIATEVVTQGLDRGIARVFALALHQVLDCFVRDATLSGDSRPLTTKAL